MAMPYIGRGKALWDFPGGAPSDLPFRVGQIVNITRKIDANWWEGELNGNIGIFPVSYVEELPLESAPALPKRPTVAASPSSPQGPTCFTCGQQINGDVLKWQNQSYHPASSCLACKKCRSPLGTESVIKKVGTEPHCQACFNELMFGPPKSTPTSSPKPAGSAPRPLPRPQPTPASPTVASPPPPPPAQQHLETPPPLPPRQGSNIHRPAPPIPVDVAPAPMPVSPRTANQPLVPHRPAPPPPVPAVEVASPPPPQHAGPYASRPTYNTPTNDHSYHPPPPAAAQPAIPYATRPAYNGAPPAAAGASPYHTPPPPLSSNGMLMAQPTGVIAHPNKPAPISPRAERETPPSYQPALVAGEAYIPPPPPPVVPVIIPPLNPYSTNKKVKAVFVGDPGVGKTAFLHAAISGVFYQAYVPSHEGGLFHVLVFTDAGKTAIDLELYDTPGDFYTNPAYRHGLLGAADVIVVMFDQLNRTSFENAEKLWYAEIRDKFFTLKPLLIIATKKDLVQSQTRYDPNFVRHQECLDFAQRVDAAKFFDSSALKNIMLRETLEKIAKLGTAPLSVIHGNRRVERVQTEKKKEGKRGVFGSIVDEVKYGTKLH